MERKWEKQKLGWICLCKVLGLELLSGEESEVAECTSSGKSFQIFGASQARLRPKCLDELYTEVAKCGTSRYSLAFTCVINTKERYKTFWITTM